MPRHYPVRPGMCPFGLTLLFMGRFWKFQILCGLAWAIAWGHSTGTCRAIALVLLEIAQLGSALLGHLPEATALEPVKLPLILGGVCSLSSANYFPNPFGIFIFVPFQFLSDFGSNFGSDFGSDFGADFGSDFCSDFSSDFFYQTYFIKSLSYAGLQCKFIRTF